MCGGTYLTNFLLSPKKCIKPRIFLRESLTQVLLHNICQYFPSRYYFMGPMYITYCCTWREAEVLEFPISRIHHQKIWSLADNLKMILREYPNSTENMPITKYRYYKAVGRLWQALCHDNLSSQHQMHLTKPKLKLSNRDILWSEYHICPVSKHLGQTK